MVPEAGSCVEGRILSDKDSFSSGCEFLGMDNGDSCATPQKHLILLTSTWMVHADNPSIWETETGAKVSYTVGIKAILGYILSPPPFSNKIK